MRTSPDVKFSYHEDDTIIPEIGRNGYKTGRKIVLYQQSNQVWRYIIVSGRDSVICTGTGDSKPTARLNAEYDLSKRKV